MSVSHVLQALLVVLIWGVNFVVIRWGLNEVPPFLLAAARFSLVVFPAIFFIKKPNVPWRWLIAYGLFNSFGQFAFLFWAMKVGMPAGLASVVHQAQVFFTLIFSVLILQQRTQVTQWLGLMIAVLGLALIAYGKNVGSAAGMQMTTVGLLLNLLGAASWAMGNVVVSAMRRAGIQPEPFGLVIWSSLIPILPFLLISGLFERHVYPDWQAISWHSMVSALYLAWAATLLGYGLWSRLLSQYEPNRVAPFTLLVPVVGLLTAWLVLGERLNFWQLWGSACLLIGLVVNVLGLRAWRAWLAWRHR
ncbi:MAG: EamA family transporter [Burkholderiaceae bacterium]